MLLNVQQYILLRIKRCGQGCQNTKYTVKGEVVKCDKTLIALERRLSNAQYCQIHGDRSLHIQGSVSMTKPNPRPELTGHMKVHMPVNMTVQYKTLQYK